MAIIFRFNGKTVQNALSGRLKNVKEERTNQSVNSRNGNYIQIQWKNCTECTEWQA